MPISLIFFCAALRTAMLQSPDMRGSIPSCPFSMYSFRASLGSLPALDASSSSRSTSGAFSLARIFEVISVRLPCTRRWSRTPYSSPKYSTVLPSLIARWAPFGSFASLALSSLIWSSMFWFCFFFSEAYRACSLARSHG